MGSPAPAGPGQAAGSPRRTFHIRKQPYKSRFRRRLPAPYMAIPAPGWGGGVQTQAAAGRARPPPGSRSARKPRAVEERGCCSGRWHRSLGERPADPGVAAVFSRAELPLAPTPFAQLALLASPPSPRRSQAPAAHGQRRRALGSLDVEEFSGCWQRAQGRSCPLPEKGNLRDSSGLPGSPCSARSRREWRRSVRSARPGQTPAPCASFT